MERKLAFGRKSTPTEIKYTINTTSKESVPYAAMAPEAPLLVEGPALGTEESQSGSMDP